MTPRAGLYRKPRDPRPVSCRGRASDDLIVGFQSMAPFATARQKGYEKVFTYIRSDNPAALAAYQRHGFKVVGNAERHAKVAGRYIDVIIVERHL